MLSIAAELGLVDQDIAEDSQVAYRYYRQQQHNTRLRDTAKTIVNAQLLAYYQIGKQLWTQVLAAEPTS